MIRAIIATLLSGILVSSASVSHSVSAQTAADAQTVERARAGVQKLGVGRSARVEVKLRDDTKVNGYVSAADEESFTVTDQETGANRTIAYADVTQVKKAGGGLSPRTWVILGAAAAAAVIVGVTVIKPVLCDGGAGC